MITLAVTMVLIGTASIVYSLDDSYAETTEENYNSTELSTDYSVSDNKILIVKDTITIKGNVTISGGGIIKRGVNHEGALFLVKSNSTLTLENITIDGEEIQTLE